MNKELKIELLEVGDIKPYEKNAKKHPAEQIKLLADLIEDKGWTQPIVVDRNKVIIVGHGRRLAALEMKSRSGKDKLFIPVVVRSDLSDAEANAMRLSDNRVTSTDYDIGMLQEELSKLNEQGVDLGSLAFSDKELEFLIGDVTEMNLGAFTDDVAASVADQHSENDEKIVKAQATEAVLAEGFGFRRLSASGVRRVRAFMARIETETGLSGEAALMGFFDEMGVV